MPLNMCTHGCSRSGKVFKKKNNLNKKSLYKVYWERKKTSVTENKSEENKITLQVSSRGAHPR